MEREIARWLPYILGGMFVLGVLLFLLALQQLRLRRTGRHWRSRRRAGDRGGRLFVISVFLMAGSVALAIVSGLATLAYRNINPLPTRGPDNLYGIVLSPEVLLTATAEVVAQNLTATSAAVTATASPVPPTETASVPPVTATRTPTAAATAAPRLTTTRTPTSHPTSTSTRLSVDAVSDQYSVSAPSLVQRFSAGIKRVYVYISFEHMDSGTAWSRVLYCNGAALQGDTLFWSLSDSGSSYFFFGDQAGYRSGSYEVRLFVGKQEMSRYRFTLMDARES